MVSKILIGALCIIGLCNGALAQETSRPCTLKRLSFDANNQVSVPASGANIIWGGSATAGDESKLKGNTFFTDVFLKGQTKARDIGLETFLYTEGKCGKTGGVDDGEIAKCKIKFSSWDQANPKRLREGPLWQQYTLAQLAAAKQYNVTYCEADNVEDGAAFISFLKAFERAYRKGDITCKLVLKNVEKNVIDTLGADENKRNFTDFSFLAPFAIFENDVGSTAGLDIALRKLTNNPDAITMISSDTFSYGKAFKPYQVLTCGSSNQTSPVEPQGSAPAPSSSAK